MSNLSEWDCIKTPKCDYIVRKVSEKTSLPMFFGKDSEGRWLFILELDGDHKNFFQKNLVSVFGINLDLRQVESLGPQNFVITLEKHLDRDIFNVLCNSLINVLKEICDSKVALAVAISHIKRWKNFLAGRKSKILSRQEVLGLYSELYFLNDLLTTDNHIHDFIVSAWVGPDDSHQDFIFSNTAVEVKAISGRERNSVRISSEDQLESLVDHLYLKVYRLGETVSESKAANSLNSLVKLIDEKLYDQEACELFYRKLSIAGYLPLAEYDNPLFLVLREQTYVVREGFPRISKSFLSPGILKVSYEISLSSLEDYSTSNDIKWRQ